MELCPGLHPLSAQAIRLMSFITEPGPIRKMPPHLGEPLEPPPISPARGLPTDWGELSRSMNTATSFNRPLDELPVIGIHSL